MVKEVQTEEEKRKKMVDEKLIKRILSTHYQMNNDKNIKILERDSNDLLSQIFRIILDYANYSDISINYISGGGWTIRFKRQVSHSLDKTTVSELKINPITTENHGIRDWWYCKESCRFEDDADWGDYFRCSGGQSHRWEYFELKNINKELRKLCERKDKLPYSTHTETDF